MVLCDPAARAGFIYSATSAKILPHGGSAAPAGGGSPPPPQAAPRPHGAEFILRRSLSSPPRGRGPRQWRGG